MVQRAIGSESVLRDWGMVNVDTFNTVIYSQFIKAYGIHQRRADELAKLPSSVLNMLNAVSENMMLGGGDKAEDAETTA